jgi:pseudoazurin
MNTLKTQIVAVLGLMLCAASVGAADIEIRMLDKSETEGMLAFEPSFVKANLNDTLVFIPVNPGHNTSSLLIPAKAEGWKGQYDKETRVKLEKEGVYLYVCDSHKPMGMVGVVQVGKAVNLEEAKKKAAEESARMVMNKDRFTKALEKVQ